MKGRFGPFVPSANVFAALSADRDRGRREPCHDAKDASGSLLARQTVANANPDRISGRLCLELTATT